ncbi:lysophospholipid acyltransferase family protein [Pararhizobium antarcticum]|uniref:lysophospholipid acyltransferase family protein n=1 Tax=Pararhizobium antarcticum TaxID=1798805 RepID=UPI0015872A49|nr:lipid A biosynthesis lauroyl acyltransferase [Pararhizobium antarcticum]
MTQGGKPSKSEISRRKAWIFSQADRPGLADLFAGGLRGRAFRRYWVTDNFWNGVNLLGFFGMKLLPMDVCSAIGARLGLFAIPRFYKAGEKRARDTIRQLCPEKTAEEQDALFRENCRMQGRLMTEFSVVNRIAKHPERITLHGIDIIDKAVREGPTIIVSMHLGNWEIGPILLQRINVSPHSFYLPPNGRAKAWIAERVRRKAGLQFLPPGFQGVRPAMKILKNGGVINAFCDEGFGGVIRGPLFGREPHMEGNLALVVRLARATGATICPWYNLRTEGFRFVGYALPAIKLPHEETPGARTVDDILLLNAALEPVVRAHLDQWYYLDNALRRR